ncbi:MAG: LysR family transcriptional regulator [Neomegalonema sp.]|nr:LysR family transcriptional regulator [Neomegalonema sp.]
MDRFSEMEMFVRVVEAGGFTEAARRLNVSKSAVSKQIAALEQRLGARLLDRTTRRVSPTEIGLAYFDKASHVLAEVEEADAMAASLQDEPRGELRVSGPHSFGISRLSKMVANYALRHPQVQISLSLDDRFVELIAEGFDIAIRIGQMQDSTLKARKLGETQLLLVASPAYLQARGHPDRVEALSTHELLHYSNLASGQNWRLRAENGEEKLVRAGGRLSVNNGNALLAAVEQGVGIALLPDFIYGASLSQGRVEAVLPQATREPLGIWAVTPPGRFTPPKVRSFIDFLSNEMRRGDMPQSDN